MKRHQVLLFTCYTLLFARYPAPGTLSFLTYYLLKHPHVMRKLREEIDTTIGDRPMNVKDVNKLPYLLGEKFRILFCS